MPFLEFIELKHITGNLGCFRLLESELNKKVARVHRQDSWTKLCNKKPLHFSARISVSSVISGATLHCTNCVFL